MKTVYSKAKKQPRGVSESRLIRAVASSTAIETGESVSAIEKRLKSGRSRFKHLKLA